jgi:hypothetical protein
MPVVSMRNRRLRATMKLPQHFFLIAAALCSIAAGHADEHEPVSAQPVNVACIKQPGFIGGPFVPSTTAARLIYLAVAEEIAPDRLKQYPIVTVEDRGDHWEVSQTRNEPEAHLQSGQVVVSAGGGQLYMNIDKCSGAISKAAFNR